MTRINKELAALSVFFMAAVLYIQDPYQVNFQTQFPAQNQFFIDDYNSINSKKVIFDDPYEPEIPAGRNLTYDPLLWVEGE